MCGDDIVRKKSTIGGENMAQNTIKLNISGMTCQGCADTVARYLKREKGVLKVSVDWKGGSGEVVIDSNITSEEDILSNAVFQGHYSASLAELAQKSR